MKKKSDPQKIIGLIWANPFSPNMGVAALTYSALYLLDRLAEAKNQKFRITVIGSSVGGAGEVNILDRRIPFFGIKRRRFFSIKSFLLFFLFPKRSEIYQSLKFDYVFDLGEGDSYTDLYGKKRFRLLNDSKVFYRWIGKRQMLLPQTVGPFMNVKIRDKAFNTLRRVHSICLRDRMSYEFVREHLPDSHVEESVDMAFLLPAHPISEPPTTKKSLKIGINISALLWGGGYTGNNQFQLGVDYRKLMMEMIEYFGCIPETSVCLVGHVFDSNRGIENDQTVNESLKKKYPFLGVAPAFRDPVEAKTHIGGYDFFIGARMHACIAAFSSGVPVFPVAYSRKFNGLFVHTLQYDHVGDCVSQSHETIMKAMKSAFVEREKISGELLQIHSRIVSPKLRRLQNLLSGFMDLDDAAV